MRGRFLARAASVGLGLCSSPMAYAAAQAGTDAHATADQPADAQTGVGDIVVTAQRRSETLQKVPLAVSAVSADTLQNRNIVNVQDFSAVAPNVSFGELNGFARINIRGIGNQNYFTGGDPSVTMYVDGAVISQAAAQLSAFFDLERVEVLRGPQGTLYGRNATGGSVNLIARKPTDTIDGYANVSLGNYDQVQVEGAIGGPVADGVNARISIFRLTRNGFGKNEFDGRDIDDANRLYGRAQLEVDKGDHNLLLAFQFGREKDIGYQVHVFGQANPGPAGAPTGVLLGGSLATSVRNMNSEAPLKNYRKTYSLTSDYNVDLSDSFKLRAITNYRTYDHDFISDIDGTAVRFAAVQQKLNSKTFSQELQLNYESDAFHAVTGLYYFHEKLVGNNNLGGPGPTVRSPAGGPPGPFYTALIGAVKVDAVGAFAQGTYKILPTLGFTAGIRYSDESRNGSGTFQGPSIIVPAVSVPRKIHDTNVSYKLGLDWNVTDDVLAYASYSTGFKSGVILVGSSDPAAKPETVKAWEAGIKSDLLDRHLRVNLSAFTYNYTDLQISQLLVGASVPTVTNAATAKIKGVEAEIVARPLERLTVSGNIGYLDSKFANFTSRDPRVPGASPLVDLTGNQLPYAPKWSGDIHGELAIPLGKLEQKVRLTASADAVFSSRVEFSVFNQADLAQAAVTRYDANIRLEGVDSGWSLSAWAKNLTNETVFANRTVGGGISTNRAIYGVVAPPRTYGVTVGFEF